MGNLTVSNLKDNPYGQARRLRTPCTFLLPDPFSEGMH